MPGFSSLFEQMLSIPLNHLVFFVCKNLWKTTAPFSQRIIAELLCFQTTSLHFTCLHEEYIFLESWILEKCYFLAFKGMRLTYLNSNFWVRVQQLRLWDCYGVKETCKPSEENTISNEIVRCMSKNGRSLNCLYTLCSYKVSRQVFPNLTQILWRRILDSLLASFRKAAWCVITAVWSCF